MMSAPRLAVVFALATLARAARAQQPDSAASPSALKRLTIEQLMNLEVTSVSRHPESLSRAASAIQVITHEDLRRSGATSLAEALRLASNLEVAQIDAREWAISARGFNSSTANKLLVLIDGRSVYTPLFAGVFWDVQDVPLWDVDRIEVISGPGATLWGSNAVNGVINVITKDAGSTQGAYATAGAGNALQGLAGLRWGGAAGSRMHYRVYAKAFQRAAAQFPADTSAQDDWRIGRGGFRADWAASDQDQVMFQGDIYAGTGNQVLGADLTLNGGDVVGRWSHTFSETSDAHLQFYYDRTHRDLPLTTLERLAIYDIDFQHHIGLGRHDVVWGAGYRRMDDHVVNTPAFAFLPPDLLRELISGFVQDEIAVIPNRFHVIVGTKLEHNDYTGLEVQPNVRLSWTPQARGNMWAAVSRAVRTPARIDHDAYLPGQAAYRIAGGPTFVSEDALVYELGYRLQAHRRFSVSLAGYVTDYDNIRTLESVNPPTFFPLQFMNGKTGTGYGAEAAVAFRATNRWSLHLGYTELRVKLEPKPGSADTSHTSTEASDPDRQVLVRSLLDLSHGFTFDVIARYIGPIQSLKVPDYGEVDSRAAWSPIPSLRISLVGQNLLHAWHTEFGGAIARQVQRSVYAQVEWQH